MCVCMQILSLLRPVTCPAAPGGRGVSRWQDLVSQGRVSQSLAITPGKVSRHRSRGAGFGVVISHVEHDHQSMNLELRRVWEVYGVHIK